MLALLSPTRSVPSPALPPGSPPAASASCCRRFQSSRCSDNRASSSFIRLHRPFLPYPRSQPGLCLAASPGPGEPGTPPDEGPLAPKGVWPSIYKLQNAVQIFFAVLFWMSLFFWASAWDGRNRPNKGRRFKR